MLCLHTVHALFMGLTTILFKKKIKNGTHSIIHTFKNYFVTVFSVFSFNKNKLYPNGPVQKKTKKKIYNLASHLQSFPLSHVVFLLSFFNLLSLNYCFQKILGHLVWLFEQHFSIFKQHYTYFYIFFHSHIFLKNTNTLSNYPYIYIYIF